MIMTIHSFLFIKLYKLYITKTRRMINSVVSPCLHHRLSFFESGFHVSLDILPTPKGEGKYGFILFPKILMKSEHKLSEMEFELGSPTSTFTVLTVGPPQTILFMIYTNSSNWHFWHFSFSCFHTITMVPFLLFKLTIKYQTSSIVKNLFMIIIWFYVVDFTIHFLYRNCSVYFQDIKNGIHSHKKHSKFDLMLNMIQSNNLFFKISTSSNISFKKKDSK